MQTERALRRKDPYLHEQSPSLLERSTLIGRWFAATGTTANIYSAWGVDHDLLITELVLYSGQGNVREVEFHMGHWKIVTGTSKGKVRDHRHR